MLSKTDIIEALLFAAAEPVPLEKLASAADITLERAQEEVNALRDEKARFGAIQVVEVAGGWQFATKPAFAPWVKKLRDEKKPRLSRAAFETLAIIAYRQPATRADVEALRGVDCSGPLGFLLERKLVLLSGRKEAPGRPWLYATGDAFLEQFGLRSLDDLPSLDEFSALNEGSLDLFAPRSGD